MSSTEMSVNPEVAAESEVAPEVVAESTPEVASESTPEVAEESAPEAAPEATPEAAPEATPEAAPEAAPEVAPEAAPEVAPEAAPEAAPEPAPQQSPPPQSYAPQSNDGQINLLNVPINNENDALNALIGFLSVAQRRGTFAINESAKIFDCVRRFQR